MFRDLTHLQSVVFFFFFVFLTVLTLISSKSNYGGWILTLGEKNLQEMSGNKHQVTLSIGWGMENIEELGNN